MTTQARIVKTPKSSPGTKSQSLCDRCTAHCCRYFALQLDTPETKRDFEDLRWYLLHHDCEIWVQDGDWHLQINRPCKALGADHRCMIYDDRPEICREYTTDECDWHGGDYDYEHHFTHADQIAEFARNYLAAQRRKPKNNGKKKTTRTKRKKAARA